MRKWTKLALAMLLSLALCAAGVSALADYIPADAYRELYVNRESINVYEEPSTDSEVMQKLPGATGVVLEGTSEAGDWLYIAFENEYGGTWMGWVQADCMTDSFPQSLCRHKYDDWIIEQPPTCTEEGYGYRFCTICGIRDEKSIPMVKHEYGKWKVTKEATCAQKGERTRTCVNCGREEKETYLDDHTFGSWSLTKEPTCTETGERVHTCKVCGFKEKQTLDKLPHDYAWEILEETTDHSAGLRAKICKVCGHKGGEESFDPEGTLRRKAKGEAVRAMQQLLVEQGYLNAGGADGIFGGGTEKALMKYQQDRGLNPDGIGWPQTLKDLEHDFGPWETVKPMTRTEPGERVRTCRGCGFEQHEIIESGTVFEKGRRGEDVRALQQIIKEVGYDAGGFDGIYGKKLDAALAGFGADKGMVVEAGRIRPADVDAVVSAWLKAIPDDDWKGEGSVLSPVNLALTVTSAGEADDSGIVTYSWSLTNLGDEKAMFNALLLSFGDEPDYRADSLVMVLDGIELKPGAGNSASGSFTASAGWGEGSMNFAAMAVSEADGAKWLSNTVSFENDANPGAKTVAPMAVDVDVNDMPDGIYPVSFNRGDLFAGASGSFMNAVHIYTQDWYDIVDVNTLAAGDTVIVEGEEIPVVSVERGEYGITVNAGQDDEFTFASEEDSNGFFIRGLDDIATYTDHGVTTLQIDPSATFTDAWDIESEPVTVDFGGIIEAMQSSEVEYFVQYNTVVRVEDGKVVEINRCYVP